MKRKYKNIEFTLSCYRWGDHDTKAYIVAIDHDGGNHRYIRLPLDRDQMNRVWTAAITKGMDAGRDEVKRIYRRLLKQGGEYIHYPYCLDTGEIISLQRDYAKPGAPIDTRLRVKRNLTAAMEADKWIYKPPVRSGSMRAIDGELRMVEDKEQTVYTVIKNSQFSRTVFTSTFWDDLRKQGKAQ